MTISRRRGGRPTAEEAALIDDLILPAARTVFCQKGIVGASMDDVAAQCGVSKHTIYRRYESKLALVDAVAQRDLGTLAGRIAAAGQSGDPVSDLRQTARCYLDFNAEAETAAFASLVLAEAVCSHDMRETLTRWSRIYVAPMMAHVESAQRQGRMAQGPARQWCLLLTDLMGSGNHLHHYGDVDSFAGDGADAFFASRWRVFCLAGGIVETAEAHSPACG